MNEEYPDDYWQKQHEAKPAWARFWHGCKFAWRNKMFFRWLRTYCELGFAIWLVKFLDRHPKIHLKYNTWKIFIKYKLTGKWPKE